ncbi:hypothetical protein ACFU3J_27910 [Streptomyces sp. NPDC057411]|uniref:hypothetical protein n=1 Tax=unclassified Streptomyces TaxID=2593676 RepID=UPI00363E036E
MKHAVLLSLAGALVLAGSATTATMVLLHDDVTVSASCAPVMDTDRDKAGLVDHIAVVTAEEQSRPLRSPDGVQRVTVQVKVDEVLKGNPPATIPVDQEVTQGARPEFAQQPLVPGHRYVIGVHNWDTGIGRNAFFATSADGDQLQTERARWADAVAHQNPKRAAAGCKDVVTVP